MANHETTREGTVPPPKCKAILLCERRIVEKGTEQVSLIGLFEELQVRGLPSNAGPIMVYLLLTDGVVEHVYNMVEVRDLLNDIVIAATDGATLQWDDRLGKITLLLRVERLVIDHEGNYDVVAFADGQEVERLPFRVIVRQNS